MHTKHKGDDVGRFLTKDAVDDDEGPRERIHNKFEDGTLCRSNIYGHGQSGIKGRHGRVGCSVIPSDVSGLLCKDACNGLRTMYWCVALHASILPGRNIPALIIASF